MLAGPRLIPADRTCAGALQGCEGVCVEHGPWHQRKTDENALVTLEDGQYIEKPVQSSR